MESRTFASKVPRDAPSPVFIGPVPTTDGNTEEMNVTSGSLTGLVDNGEIAAAAGARLDRSNFSSNKSNNIMEAGSSSADAEGNGTEKIKEYIHCSDTVESGFPRDFSTILGATSDGGNLGTHPSDSSSMPSRYCAEKSEAAPEESNFPVQNSAVGNFQPNNFNLPPDVTLQRYGADCSDSKNSCIINSLDTNVRRNRNNNSIAGLFAVLNNDASNNQSIVSQTAATTVLEQDNNNVETCNSFLIEEREILNASPSTKTPSMKTHEKYNDTVKINRQSSNFSARKSDLFAPAESDSQKDALSRIPRKAPKTSKRTPKDQNDSSKQPAINRQTQQPPKIAKIAVETREKKKLKPSAVTANASHAESADRIKSSAKVMTPSSNPVKEPIRRSSGRKRIFTSFYADEQAVDRVTRSSKRKGGKTKRNSDDEVTGICDDENESGGLGIGDGTGHLNNDQTFRRNDNEQSAIIENETNWNDCPGRTRMHEVYKRKSPAEQVSRNVTDSIEKDKIALLDFSDHGAGCKELEKLRGEGYQANHESSALGDEGIDEATVQCDDYDDPKFRRKGNKFAKRSKTRFGRADSSTGPTPKRADINSMQQIQREPISEPPEANGGGDRKRSRKATADSLAQERSTEERDEVSAYSATVETTSAIECRRLPRRKFKSSRKTSETTSRKVQVSDYPLTKESRLRRKSCLTGVSVEALGPGISASQAISAHVCTRFPKNKVSRDLQLSPTRNSNASVHDDCISHSVKALEQSTQCKGQLNTYAKDLPPAPRQGWQVYEEESAWRFYNPDFPKGESRRLNVSRTHQNIPHMVLFESDDELRPLPPPPPLPKFPETGHCTWSYNNDTRVVLANFHSETLHHDDQNFLLRMMERDDITVISEGLAGNLDQSLWTVGSISDRIGSDFHHKIRVFRKSRYKVGKEEFEHFVETKEWYKMRVSDYLKYLAMICDNQMNGLDQNVSSSTVSKWAMPQAKKKFMFQDCDGCKHTINDVNDEALYAVDLDLVKLLPWLHKDFERNFRLPDILPGGRHCMMDAVNPNGRPFMGPNLYMTPPGTYTHIHQDGHGTVDSGHFCLSGYNEVLMIRRIVERHKIHAVELLMGKELPAEDILYGLPHCDDQVSQWPTKDSIKKCEEMGYCPSVFILKPGQMVHINKGRLHAFRKMSSVQLPKTDCHCELRDHILSSLQHSESLFCASIAWDWMYKGISSEGINREVSSILECARLNRSRRLQSLAIPETTLLYLAKNVIADFRGQKKDGNKSIILLKSARIYRNNCIPSSTNVLRGILPSLQFVVSKHSSSSRSSEKCQLDEGGYDKLEIISKPNTHENPDVFALDPYGSSDFFCKICMEELSNVYLHCMGCEKLLGKDFNICVTCHCEGEYRDFFQMHPFDTKRRAELNHTGNMKNHNKARCRCKNGRLCTYCGYCTGCSCKCHRWFGLYYRFMSMEEEQDLLSQAEEIVGSDEILHGTETKARLFSLIQGATFDGQPTIQSCDVLSSFPGPYHDSDSTASPNAVGGSTAITEATTAELSSRDVSLHYERSTAASITGSECTTVNIKVAEVALPLLKSTKPDQLHGWSKQASSLIQSDALGITDPTSQTSKADETASKDNINLRTTQRSIHPLREKTTIAAAGNRYIGQMLLRGGTIVDTEAASSPSESTIAVEIHPQIGYSTNNKTFDHGVQSALDINHGEPASVTKSHGYKKKSEHNQKGEHENSSLKKNQVTAALPQRPMFEEEEKEARIDIAALHQVDNGTTLLETSLTDCAHATGESFSVSPAVVKAAIGDFDNDLSSCVQKPVVGSLATRQDERSATKFNTTENGEETNFDALKYAASATCDDSATTIRLASNITHKNVDSTDDTPSENTIRGESFSMPKASNNSEDRSIYNNVGIEKRPPTQHIHRTLALSQLSEETGIDVVLEDQQNILTPQNKTSFTGFVDATELTCSASTVVAKTVVGVFNDVQCTGVQEESVMKTSAAGKNEETTSKCKTSDEREQPIMSESRDANPATCDKSATTILHVGNITPKDIDASGVSPSGSSATMDRGGCSAGVTPCKVDHESKVYDVDGSGNSLPRKLIHETSTPSQLHVSDNQHGDSTNSFETTLIDCVGAAESSFITSPAVAKTAVGDFGDGLCSSVQESVIGSSAPGKNGETTTNFKATKNGEQPIMSASRDAPSATCGESAITICHVGNITPKDIDATGSGSPATIDCGEYSTETKPCDKSEYEWKFNVVDGSDNDPSKRIGSVALSQLSLQEVQEDNLGDMVHNHCDDLENPIETLFLKCEKSTSIPCIAGPALLDTVVGSSGGTASVPKAVENIIDDSRSNHTECHNSPPGQHIHELTAILQPPEKASFDVVAQNKQDETSSTDCERATDKTCIASQAVAEAAINAYGYGQRNCFFVPGRGSLTSRNDDESAVRSSNNFSRLFRGDNVLRYERVTSGALTKDKTDLEFRDKHLDSTFPKVTLSTSAIRELGCAISRVTKNTLEVTTVNRHCRSRVFSCLQESDAYVEGEAMNDSNKISTNFQPIGIESKTVGQHQHQKSNAISKLEGAQREPSIGNKSRIHLTMKKDSQLSNDDDSVVSSLSPDDLTVGSRVDVEFKNKLWQADVLSFDKTNRERLKIHFVGSKRSRSRWISFHQVKNLVCDEAKKQRNGEKQKIRQKPKYMES